MGARATAGPVIGAGMGIYHLRDGLIAEHWTTQRMESSMQQLRGPAKVQA
ncbi:MAG: hypothetical protein JOZ65_03550 [Chloroflexi bacterium]|nr:hypothetical protein [Chloroflexota bacterium]